MKTIETLIAEAATIDCVVSIDEDSITLRPDGGDTCEGDVIIYADEDSPTGLSIGEGGDSNEFAGTLAEYLAERKATNNWA